MTDIGFGLADRRTVLAILFALLLSNVFLGYKIPIDTTNALNLFISLVILTGFIFLSRTIGRLILMLVYALLRTPYDLYEWLKKAHNDTRYYEKESKRERVARYAQAVKYALRRSGTKGIIEPFKMKDWKWEYIKEGDRNLAILGLCDRAILVGIIFAASIPYFAQIRSTIGLIGISLMLLTYIITGKYTFALKDAFQKSEEDHAALVNAAGTQPNIPEFPRSIETYTVDHRYDNIGG